MALLQSQLAFWASGPNERNNLYDYFPKIHFKRTDYSEKENKP